VRCPDFNSSVCAVWRSVTSSLKDASRRHSRSPVAILAPGRHAPPVLFMAGTKERPLQPNQGTLKSIGAWEHSGEATTCASGAFLDEAIRFSPCLSRGIEVSQRHERGATIVTLNLPFEDWTSVFGAERLTGALLNRLTHHVHILEMNGESYRLKQSRARRRKSSEKADDEPVHDPETGEIDGS
jgi:hypothetical protein